MGSKTFVESKIVTILSGQALSDPIDMRRSDRLTIHMPDAWDAADIGFDAASEVDGTYNPFYDALAALVIVDGPAADGVYAAPMELEQASFVKLRSNTAGADENQTADRTIVVELHRIYG